MIENNEFSFPKEEFCKPGNEFQEVTFETPERKAEFPSGEAATKAAPKASMMRRRGRWKKLMLTVSAFVAVTTLATRELPKTVHYENDVYSVALFENGDDKSGNHVVWEFRDGTLTLRTDGTKDYILEEWRKDGAPCPWNEVSEEVTTLVVEKDIYQLSVITNSKRFSKLKTIYLSKDVQDFDVNGSRLYREVCSLREVFVDSNNPYLMSEDGAVYSKDKKKLVWVSSYLEDYEIPDGVESIASGACLDVHFKNNEIIIPESVKTIGFNAFWGSYADKVYISKNVELIDNLGRYTELAEIIVDPDNPYYSSVDGVLYDKDVTRLIYVPRAMEEYRMPDSVTTRSGIVFASSPIDGSGVKKVVLSKNFVGYSSNAINETMFSQLYSLEEIYIPSSITSISDEAFNDQMLTYHGLTIYGEKDSYAEKYAKEHGIPFVVGELELSH